MGSYVATLTSNASLMACSFQMGTMGTLLGFQQDMSMRPLTGSHFAVRNYPAKNVSFFNGERPP